MAWVLSAVVASGPNDAALAETGTPPHRVPVAPASMTATIDGVTWNSLQSGLSRVMQLNQGGSPTVPAITNGIWIYQGLGMAISRPSSPDPYAAGGTLDNETVVRISAGTALAHTEHACVTPGVITVDTTAIAHARQLVRANVKDFGATGNGGTTHDGQVITGSLTILHSASAAFTLAKVPAGTPILVFGRRQRGEPRHHGDLRELVDGDPGDYRKRTDCQPVVVWGTDDSQAIYNAINATSTSGGGLLFPPGVYAVGSTQPVTVPSNVQVTFEEGAMLAPYSQNVAQPVTLSGRVTAHPTQQIFGGAGALSTLVATGATPPAVTVSGNPLGTFSFKVEVVSAVSSTVTISNPGSGYTTPPTVTFTPSPHGITATGTATVVSGAVTVVTVTNVGSGYVTAPTISFSPASTTVATATLANTTAQLGTMAFQYSLDNGTSWSAMLESATSGPYLYAVPGTGITVAFPTGSSPYYTVGDTYTWTSTPAITLTAAASHTFPAKWWGAVGDNTADDTAAIQAAITTVGQFNGGTVLDGTVFLGPGEYKTSGMTSPYLNVFLGCDVDCGVRGGTIPHGLLQSEIRLVVRRQERA